MKQQLLRPDQNSLRASGQKGKEMNFTERLRTFDVDRCDIGELVELSFVGRSIVSEYENLGAECPDWLTINLKQLRREVKTRTADALEKDLHAKKQKLEGMLPMEERRKRTELEIAALEQKLSASV
jgi:hypothetical protein